MKTIQIMSMSLLLLLVVACNKDDNRNVKDGDRFDLAFGETVNLWEPGMTLEFNGIDDSRCPDDGLVLCITEGAAIANMRFSPGNDQSAIDFTLTAKGLCRSDDGSCGETQILEGIAFQLINIEPFRTSQVELKDSDYVLKMKIEKE